MSQDAFVTLKNPAFRRIALTSLLVTLALLMQDVVLGYELYNRTRDPLVLGWMGLAEALPFMALSLIGGHWADRYNKRTLWLLGHGLMIASAVWLWLVFEDIPVTFTLQEKIGWVYAVNFMNGLTRAITVPALQAWIPLLIPPAQYGNSSAWTSASWQTGAILGPVIGGFVYALVGLSWALGIVCGLLVVGAVLIGLNTAPYISLTASEISSISKSLQEGIQFVWHNPAILYSITLDMVAVLFGGVVAILPVFATEVLVIGADGLGLLRSAAAFGAILTTVLLTFFSPMGHPWRNLLWAVFAFGIATLVFALSEHFFLSCLALFLTGAFDSVSVVIRETLMQTLTPPEMRGRVAAVNGIFIKASNELGAFESGLAAKLIGAVPSVIMGATAALITVAVIAKKSRTLLKG
ncbi:MAG: MFS transporter [Bacteroidetes Order II. Incertae sedis bacterium]|nr:MFS transporter [Bacteroidetes Order II. bacterium]